ncbi:MAG: VOC family protein [Thalassovita sp.]|nr:VOC family protein [Thalassovita sp.]
MEQRISLITLGCRDLARAARFYSDLGWQKADSPEEIVAFNLIGQALCLYGLDDLADDIGVPVETLGRGAVTLAHNLNSPGEVDALVERAVSAGATLLKKPRKVFWGGYSGYFCDPEGHIWEIAHNPFSPLRAEDGAFRWGGWEPETD